MGADTYLIFRGFSRLRSRKMLENAAFLQGRMHH
jgi:hypothetical protein